jgi:serine/threonine-protein kinase
VGRYVVHDEIAAGGMATVHFGRLLGPVGFSRTVAIKCLHPQFAKDPEFVAMFLDEARLAARVRHPNVVSTIDVVALEGELFLVMDYVQGESLSRLMKAATALGSAAVPAPVASAIVCDALSGLHAAHEARSERDEPLAIVHRDVSPQNILVGADGVSRVLDFGIAKAASRVQTTREGELKGKFGYMSPEQLTRQAVDRRTDVYAMSIVLWEALTGARLFSSDDVGATVRGILTGEVPPPSSIVPDLPAKLDAVVLRGLARNPETRFRNAKEMAEELESAVTPARPARIGEWVERMVGEALRSRAGRIAQIEVTGGQIAGPPSGEDLRTAPTLLVGSSVSATPSILVVESMQKAGGSASTKSIQRRLHAVAILVAVSLIPGGIYMARIVSPVPSAIAAAAPTAPGSSAIATSSQIRESPSIAPIESASAGAAAAPEAGVAAGASSRAVTPRGGGAPQRARRVDNCDPPYYFDADQVKRFKPGCLY